jgi:hypothetical protein
MTDTVFEFINPRYLLGISDEPKQLLQPISGYAREPLLPLEEACEPLIPIVPRLQAHVWVAKQNSKNPADGLTQDESAAIRLYTMEWDAGVDEPRSSLYSQLNRTKIPSAPRQTVWRGVRKDHTEDYPPGEEATWWSFSSCTSSLSVLESDLYLGNVGTRTLFSIETLNGRSIRAHSYFQVEDEILLLPGTYFEVKSRLNPAPDLYIVHLQQKRPPHDLLEPPFEGKFFLIDYAMHCVICINRCSFFSIQWTSST